MSTEATPQPTPRSGRGRRASDRTVEDVLRESEEQVRGLLECAPDAMVVSDSEGRIVLVNAQVEALFGYEPEELIGKSIELLMPERFRSGHRTRREGFCEQPDGHAMRVGRELVARRRDGSEFPVEISLSSMRTPAGAMTASAAIRDITERKRVEAAAAASSRLISEFVANMSHEIRTPLNGLLGMSEMLLETDLDETQREYLDLIRRSGDALMHLVDDVLDFSKLEAGMLILDPFDFDPRAVLEEAVGMVSTAASGKGLAVVLSVDPDLPANVRTDGNRVRQVLSNLICNAVKFTSEGEVRVSATAMNALPGELRFEVADTGIGMDQDVASRIFNSFVQADTSTTRKYGGCGLGLSICRELVRLLGGQIQVASVPGVGSVFTFTVPFEPAIDATAPADLASASAVDVHRSSALNSPKARGADRAAGGAEGPRILVVEDNEVNQMVAMSHLKRLGYRVDLACDGLEAVERCASDDYRAILMDCQMPRLDGYAATGEIRRREDRGAHIPIIAMTAHTLQGDRDRCLDSGMDDFVGKPLSRRSLAAVLDRNLTREGRRRVPVERRGAHPYSAPEKNFDATPLTDIFAADEELGAEVLSLYTDQARRETDALSAAVLERDAPAAGEIAHRLKGASATVGALGVGRICDQICRQGSEHDFEHLPGSQAELLRVLALTEAEISNAFKEASA